MILKWKITLTYTLIVVSVILLSARYSECTAVFEKELNNQLNVDVQMHFELYALSVCSSFGKKIEGNEERMKMSGSWGFT